MSIHNLDRLFAPRSLAVVGASDRKGTIGAAVMHNLLESGFAGTVYPINPRHPTISGQKTYAKISDLPEAVDLVVIAVPIQMVPELIAECAATRVGAAVIISGGGKETGEQGRAVEQAIAEAARDSGVRIIGPNCLGVISSRVNLNASFAAQMPLPGSMAFISQSGAVCGAVLDLSIKEHIGFSYFVSLGSMLDVKFGDVIDYLGNDPQVGSIVMYMENLTRHRNFMSAARAVARIKPIIVLKAGRTRAGAAAAASHTGALSGEDDVYDAAFKRAGILRVRTFEELFDCAELLAKQPKIIGPGLAIITNSGGPGVMAADALADYGFEPVALSEETLKKLDAVLPPHWSRGNPIDILGDAAVDEYYKVVAICENAPEVNGLLVILVPQAMIDPVEVANAICDQIKDRPFPVLTSWVGGPLAERGRAVFHRAGIPTFDTPERAVRAFTNLWRYARNVELLQQIPSGLPRRLDFDRQKAGSLIRQGLERKSPVMTEVEAKALLAAYGIPINQTEIAFSADEAVRKAQQVGYPVVLKIYSREIAHKTEAGGVALGLENDAEVREAYSRIIHSAMTLATTGGTEGTTVQPMLTPPMVELILGAKNDPDFGPVVLFGMGGILTEVIRDRAIALPPLNRLLARRLIEDTKVYQILKGFRNQPAANLDLLEEILIQLAQLITDFAEIEELDINPLFVTGDSFRAVDARVRLKRVEVRSPMHLVISPYPDRYETQAVTRGLIKILIRPIRPEDAPLMTELFDSLTARSIYQRFLSPMKRLPTSMLARFTQIDYDREIALVAFREEKPREQMMGISRVIIEHDLTNAEFSVLVGDAWQGKGVGAELLKNSLRIARERGIESIWGLVLTENIQMLALARKLGFKMHRVPESNTYELRIDLKSLHGF
ncbi:MAG: bifunctional acetate--CoA ligase family protein/GNAT family N-acetyltransferase [Desulfobacterales bacterium]